jgi:YspA, cpYpsA-related SLOG family
MLRLLVAGGRDYYDYKFIDETLTEWVSELDIDLEEITLVHGDAQGVDRIAAQWAKYNGLTIEAHPANWTKYGKSGGNVRNAEMVESGIDFAILFPGGFGTANAKKHLVARSVHFREILDNNDDISYTK